MNLESLVSVLTSMGGGFFVGMMLGYFIKKIIKIIMFVAGGMAAFLLYLQQQQTISVDIEKLEDSFTLVLNSMFSSYHIITQVGDSISLGIPMVGGLSGGLAIGLMKG